MRDDQPAVDVTEHNGDATIEVTAADEAECLRGAVQGLASLAGASGAIAASRHQALQVDGDEPVERLVALLDELIALIDVEGLVATDARVTVGREGAQATVALAPLDPAEVVAPPKAVTWHGARCEATGDGRWHARVVVDR